MTHEEHRRHLMNEAADRLRDARRRVDEAEAEEHAADILHRAASRRADGAHADLKAAEVAAASLLVSLSEKGAIAATPFVQNACAESPVEAKG